MLRVASSIVVLVAMVIGAHAHGPADVDWTEKSPLFRDVYPYVERLKEEICFSGRSQSASTL